MLQCCCCLTFFESTKLFLGSSIRLTVVEEMSNNMVHTEFARLQAAYALSNDVPFQPVSVPVVFS